LPRNYVENGVRSQYDIRPVNVALLEILILDIKKWQIKGTGDKDQFEIRKKEATKVLKDEMVLLAGVPKPGSWTANNGSTARRFLSSLHSLLL
jgi:hypothetical protein